MHDLERAELEIVITIFKLNLLLPFIINIKWQKS